MKPYSRALATLLVLVVPVACGGGPTGETPEDPGPGSVASISQAVATGTADAQPNVGMVWLGNAAGPFCTVELVTPTWLITARHCLVGQVDEPPMNVTDQAAFVTFNTSSEFFAWASNGVGVPANFGQPGSDPDPRHARSSPTISIQFPYDGDTSLVNEVDFKSQATDVAWIQIDHRIPTSVIRPLHQPLASACPDGPFWGVLVGYGNTGEVDPAPRNSTTTNGWEFLHKSGVPGGVYTNPFYFGSTYRGSVAGDSGGALFYVPSKDSPDRVFCGVISGYFDDGIERDTNAPAIDVPEVYSQLFAPSSTPVIDVYGNWMGECAGIDPASNPAADRDSDDDLIPDACDPCPFVSDPTYRNTGRFGPQFDVTLDVLPFDGIPDVDPDKDGVPNACDNCPTQPNPYVLFDPANPFVSPVQVDEDSDGLGDVTPNSLPAIT